MNLDDMMRAAVGEIRARSRQPLPPYTLILSPEELAALIPSGELRPTPDGALALHGVRLFWTKGQEGE